MPAVFTDSTANDYDLIIQTAADWTIHAADLPNGDAAASLSTTLNQNAVWPGEDFCLPTGSGSEARTLEAWVKVTANTNARYIAAVRTNATTTGVNDMLHWAVFLNTDETIGAYWASRTGQSTTPYLSCTTSALAAGWHHVVVVFQCGSTRSITIYIDGVSSATDNTTALTPTDATTGVYEFYLGASRSNDTNEMTDHMAKVAFYDYALSPTRISDHETAMSP